MYMLALLLALASPIQVEKLAEFLDKPADICARYGMRYEGGDFPRRNVAHLTYFSRHADNAVLEHGGGWYARYGVVLPGQLFPLYYGGSKRPVLRAVYCK